MTEGRRQDLGDTGLPWLTRHCRHHQLLAAYYNVAPAVLPAVIKGPKQGLLPRKVALYRCQQLGGYPLADIMRSSGLSNIGSVSFITTQIRKHRKENKECVQTLQQVKGYILKHAYRAPYDPPILYFSRASLFGVRDFDMATTLISRSTQCRAFLTIVSIVILF